MDQGKRETFYDDRDVVRVRGETIGTGTNPRVPGDDDHTRGPVRAECPNYGPAKSLGADHERQRRPAKPRDERPGEEENLGGSADEKPDVEHDHERVVSPAVFLSALSDAPRNVSARYGELRQAFGRDGAQQN